MSVAGDTAVVVGRRCAACGDVMAVPRPRCPRCAGALATAEFGPGGRVWSTTVVHIPVAGVEPPYTLAYVDLDDGPRVLAHLPGGGPVAIGARVRLSGRDRRGDLTAEVVT